MADVPYQQEALVAQLQAERENATALGLTDRVKAADKQLAELGVKAAGQKRKAAADDEDDEETAKKTHPHGRSAKPKETAE
jgi:hypothetical protein